MKVRTGFVSNSSSSSFCAFGVIIEASDIDTIKLAKYIKQINPLKFAKNFEWYRDGRIKRGESTEIIDAALDIDNPNLFEKTKVRGCDHPESPAKFCNECGKPTWKEIGVSKSEVSEYLEEDIQGLLELSNLNCMSTEGSIYIGKSYDHSEKDMTFGEFWAAAKEELEAIGIDEDPVHINEEIYS